MKNVLIKDIDGGLLGKPGAILPDVCNIFCTFYHFSFYLEPKHNVRKKSLSFKHYTTYFNIVMTIIQQVTNKRV